MLCWRMGGVLNQPTHNLRSIGHVADFDMFMVEILGVVLWVVFSGGTGMNLHTIIDSRLDRRSQNHTDVDLSTAFYACLVAAMDPCACYEEHRCSCLHCLPALPLCCLVVSSGT
jgi:hypothetical protein